LRLKKIFITVERFEKISSDGEAIALFEQHETVADSFLGA
jgi:hypothetical protein